jgi:hypothetical protein
MTDVERQKAKTDEEKQVGIPKLYRDRTLKFPSFDKYTRLIHSKHLRTRKET